MELWIIKAFLQNIIGRMPKSYRWNMLFQKHITRGYFPSRATFEAKLNCCQKHFDHYLKFSPTPWSRFNALELGTGSWPIVPIGLYLCGASGIWTYDLVPLVCRDTLKRTLELFIEFKHEGSLNRLLPEVQEQRFLHLEKLLGQVEKKIPAQLLSKLNVHARIGDARKNALPDKFVDLIFSTVVLELISPEILNGLLAEFKRIASPDAVMSHYVGLADQYAGFDKSITPYNFLRYSDHQWRFLNNTIIPQNRLRIADYRELFKRNGWNITKEENNYGSIDVLKQIKLAEKFHQYSQEDLLVLYSWMVAKPSI